MADDPRMIDRSTIEALLAERGWVQRLARSLASDAASAEDVTQESWLRALRRPPGHTGNLRSWFGFLVRRTAKDRARGEERRTAREELAARRPSADNSPAESLERVELVRELAEALTKLAEPYRTVVVMRYLDEREPRVIAQLLGVDAATVRSRLSRGLAMLRGDLERRHGKGRDGLLSALALFIPRGTVGGGLLLMGLKTKIAAAVVLLGFLSFVGWHALQPTPTMPLAPTENTAQARVESSTPALTAATPSVRVPAMVEPRPSDLSSASLRVEVVWKKDGTPAAGIGVRAEYTDPADREQRLSQEATTAQDGSVRFSDLPPEPSVLCTDYSGERLYPKPEAGRETVARFELEDGVHVHGRVVDDAGRPVGGAAIWRMWGTGLTGHTAQFADAEGRFELRSSPEGTGVCARHPDHAASVVRTISGRPGDDLDLVFELRGKAARVRGTVRGAAGSAIAGALVWVGKSNPQAVFLGTGEQANEPYWTACESEGDGSFQTSGLNPGKTDVRVEAKGFAPWFTEFELGRAEDKQLEVQLGAGCTLEGTVVDTQGEPVANAKLHGNGAGGRLSLRTDANGRLHRAGLAPGKYHLILDARIKGHAQTELELRSGETARWNVTLDPGRVLSGVLVDSAGNPLPKWFVAVRPADNRYFEGWQDFFGREQTDAAGHFGISGLPDYGLQLSVHTPPLEGMRTVLLVNISREDRAEQRIVVPDSAVAESRVRGVLVDERGRPLGDAALSLFNTENSYLGGLPRSRLERDTGRFVLEHVHPGRYRLSISAAGYITPDDLQPFLVETGVDVDLGTIQLRERAGNLSLALTRKGGGPIGEPNLGLHDPLGNFVDLLRIEGDRARSGALREGRYQLIVRDGTLRPPPLQIEIKADETTRLDYELPALPK